MKKLGEILIERNILTKAELDQLLEKQKVTKEKLGDLVVKNGYLTEDQLLKIVAEQYGLQYVNLREVVIPVSLQKEINYEILKRYRIVPLKLEDKKLYVGINNVDVLREIDEISFNLGKNVTPVLLNAVAIDKMLTELESLPYGSKDYHYKSIETFIADGSNFVNMVKAIFNYDPTIERVFIKEGSVPLVKKGNVVDKIQTEKFSRNSILEIIKDVCDENERKFLISNGAVTVNKTIGDKIYKINVYKEKNSFLILIINSNIVFNNLLDYRIDKTLMKYIVEQSKGITFLIAPYGHGKTTFITSIIDYFNANKNYNILYITNKINNTIANINSNIIQIEKDVIKDANRFVRMINDIDPTLLFIHNLDDLEIFNNVYKFVESGRPAFISMESNSIQYAFESLLYKENDGVIRYHLNRVSDLAKLFINFRLITAKNGKDKFFVYEYCLNSFKLKKIFRENNLQAISSQLRGTGEYLPFEMQIAELFNNKLITYDIAESFSQDIELLKRYAKINS